ncbi:hypothetical protein BFP72_08280 [Reichenbachiella sp. 5M10]|nr:hypothetical protein BFP72_08280 [Reichenbachiella sp. 5M10]
MKEGFLLMASIMVICSSCHRPEYSQNYVSSDTGNFEQYKKEASNRPSPPARASRQVGGAEVFITYSQPSVKGRVIWGDLVKYDKIWRTGANEATVFTTDADIQIAGQTIKTGNYALYTIPSEGQWEIILNTKYDVWGAYDYDKTLDVLRFSVVPTRVGNLQEKMLFDISKEGVVSFSWEYLRFTFPVENIPVTAE